MALTAPFSRTEFQDSLFPGQNQKGDMYNRHTAKSHYSVIGTSEGRADALTVWDTRHAEYPIRLMWLDVHGDSNGIFNLP